MNPWRTGLVIGTVVVVAAGCSVTDRKVSGTATTATVAASPTTSTSAVAKPVDDAGLPKLLGSPSAISDLVGVAMTPEAIFRKPDTKLRVEPIRCLEAVMPGLDTIRYYGRRGFAGQLLHGDQHAQVVQVVAAFTTDADAADFRDRTAQTWRSCQKQQATITGTQVPLTYALDSVESANSVTSVSMSGTAGDGTRVPCQHSLGARRNVIIDVRVCTPNVGNKGRDLVAKIAAGL
ncbi:sensor domain-containing protein [Mycolicibacterium phocaicum]|uniref:sensor domain-containing protein n=1 Tax=Mycolicibacterium phocaicum TaxID=319706 RepID=UPI001CFC02D2|nr:sensor domain-containing protein [Mycolicibacterium phocaicum]UCZ60737.1 sensor domain-containing protein [Mycolicibacterium phocaicum]